MRTSDFERQVLPLKHKIFRLAKRLLVSNEEAEDATQEIIIKLWKAKSKLNLRNNLEAYTITMTRNFCLDRLKSKQAQQVKLKVSHMQVDGINLHKQVEAKDTLKWVSRFIETLPEKQQLVVHLRDVEQYSIKEISNMINMTETAVRVNLSRGRKLIKEALSKTHDYGTR